MVGYRTYDHPGQIMTRLPGNIHRRGSFKQRNLGVRLSLRPYLQQQYDIESAA